MPKNWGSHLGIIDMQLELDGGKWKVKDASAKTEAIAGNVTSRNETVVSAIKDTHEKRSNTSARRLAKQKLILTAFSRR